MNSFDLMIERYKKELIDAKRRSIEKEIVEAENENAEAEQTVPVLEAIENTDSKAEKATFVNAPINENESEPLGLLNPVETAAQISNEVYTAEPKGEITLHENDDRNAKTTESKAERESFQSENDIPDDEDAVFDEDEPFPESLGALKVQVFMANRAYPISSAHVVITGKENKKVYFDGYTNTNGVVGSILLPAPKKTFSQSPQENPPYSQYDITVSHPKFQSRKYLGVPVFSGIESIQNIQLLPLGTDEEDNTDVTESEPNELLMKGGESNA